MIRGLRGSSDCAACSRLGDRISKASRGAVPGRDMMKWFNP